MINNEHHLSDVEAVVDACTLLDSMVLAYECVSLALYPRLQTLERRMDSKDLSHAVTLAIWESICAVAQHDESEGDTDTLFVINTWLKMLKSLR